MKLSELKRILELSVFTILGFYGGVWVSRMFVQNINDTEYYKLLTAGLGFAVSLLTLYVLTRQVEESEKDRKQIIEENKKTRHASYLSDQLDFYAELRGGFSPLVFIEMTQSNWDELVRGYYSNFSSILSTLGTKLKHEKCATEHLQDMLAEYFGYYDDNFDDAWDIYAYKHNVETGKRQEALYEFLKSIVDRMNNDYEKLIQEYRSITIRNIDAETT